MPGTTAKIHDNGGTIVASGAPKDMAGRSETAERIDGVTGKGAIRDAVRRYAPLWPLVLGLTFARAGLIVGSYGSYTSTDEGIFTDGAMLVALIALIIILIAITAGNRPLRKRIVNRIMRFCIALETCCLVGFALLDFLAIDSFPLRFTLSVLCTISASGAICYWLRRARGTSTAAAAVFVFSALILSEIQIYLYALLPVYTGNLIAAAFVVFQYPCMIWARTRTQPHRIEAPTQESDYFGFAKTMIQNKRFLMATAIGVGCLSIVIGLLRGYPDGHSVAFEPLTRLAYGLLTILLCSGIILLVLRGQQRVMTVGIFMVMQFLACWALVCYAAFPGMLDIGAVFTTTLNALMVGFTWYVIVAFMSFGWRDPYYYAIGGWLVWLGCRGAARIALLEFYQFSTNTPLISILMGCMIVLSTQVVFVQFLDIARQEHTDQEDNRTQKQSKLIKLMGLDETDSLSNMRQMTMQHSAEELGKQFLLSDREIEVLTLYALGFTQKRVAEELFITPGTAHAHIKRIYAKTGLHSRQEILDYMQHYTS